MWKRIHSACVWKMVRDFWKIEIFNLQDNDLNLVFVSDKRQLYW